MPLPTALELAKAFAEELGTVLTAEQLEKVNDLNADARYSGLKNVCHSHDFCDANQVMIDAMGKFGLEYSADHNALINEAWEIAKQAEFSPSLMDADERGMREHE